MEGEGAVPRYRRSFEQDRYGEQVPLFSTAFIDRDRRLWVGESTWAAAGPPRRWSVFSSEGHWLGDVEAPDRFTLLDSRGDGVLGIWQDDLDVPYVQLHRLIQE
ncbi:MAG: hypothetical protein ACRD2X_01135 [Vicinamibacteraceae bacterium]